MSSTSHSVTSPKNSSLSDPWTRLHDTVDGLEAYLRLLQDEGEGHMAPFTGCKQQLERIRRLANEAAQASPANDASREMALVVSEMVATDYEAISCEGTACYAWNPPWLTRHDSTNSTGLNCTNLWEPTHLLRVQVLDVMP